MFFRQIFDRESCTYTYLLADEKTKEAVLIDPVIEHTNRDSKLLDELGLTLCAAVNTHVHADHVFANGELKKKWTMCVSVLGETGNEEAKADVRVKDGSTMSVGGIDMEFLSTPGHTAGCHSIYVEDKNSGKKMVFTGDAVLIRGCGRTDFQGGSAKNLYKAVHSRVFSLAPETIIYPAHDYKGMTESSVEEEMKFNPRLTKSEDEFIEIMNNLGLPYPKKIDASLPLNLVCGLHDLLSTEEKAKVPKPTVN